MDRDPELLMLIEAAQRGDQDALATLLRRSRDRIAAILRWRLDSGSRAAPLDEGLVNEALAAAARSLAGKHFSSSGAFLNWLATIAASKLVDSKRREATAKRGEGRERAFSEFQSSSLGLSAFTADQTTPSEAAHRAEILERLPRAITSLSPSEHRAYDLVMLCGLSREQAASEMAVTEGALRGYLTRATAKISSLLSL